MLDLEEIPHSEILYWDLTPFQRPSMLAMHQSHLGSLIKILTESETPKVQPAKV